MDARRLLLGPALAAPAQCSQTLVHEERIDAYEGWEPTVALPAEAESWTLMERDLFLQSDGEYCPASMARLRRTAPGPMGRGGTGCNQEVRGRVSVVTPTMSCRQHYHEQLWKCFLAQTWPDKELIVVETFEDAPSSFLQHKAKEDSRLVHVCLQRAADADFNVGLKRDMTLHLASGEFVANFDDDDVYAPSYLAKMVGELRWGGAVAVTLSHWYNFFVGRGTCGYSDPDSWDPDELEEVLYGYGFSYVHRRREALALPYPNVDFAEDAPFLLKLREVWGDDKVRLKKDEEGICMHIMHRANSTGDPDTSRQVTSAELADLEVSSLPLFQKYLDAQPQSCWAFSSLSLTSFSVWQWASPTPASARGQKACL